MKGAFSKYDIRDPHVNDVEKKGSTPFDSEKYHELRIKNLEIKLQNTEAQMKSVIQTVTNLINGLFCNAKQQGSLDECLKLLYNHDEELYTCDFHGSWGHFPTTRQGDVLEEEMKQQRKEIDSLKRTFISAPSFEQSRLVEELLQDIKILKEDNLKMASWIYYFDQAGDIRLPQVERELNEERFKKIEARLTVNERISTSEAADQIDLLKEKIAEIEEMEANYLKSVNKLSSEVFDMRYAVKHIASGLYNMDTQRATWKDLMALIDKNNIFKTNSKFDASLQTTSKWHDLPTTRQGDECEARLDKVEVKGGEYDGRLKRLEAKMQMIAKGFAESDDC